MTPARPRVDVASRRAIVGLALAFVTACDCAPPIEPARVEAPAVDTPLGAVGLVQWRRATSSLTPAVPRITLVLDTTGITVSNRALVGSWPPAERERLAAAPPRGAREGYPVIDVHYAASEMALVGAALRSCLDVERARSGSGAPTVYALEVAPAATLDALHHVMWAAALEGFITPRFVVTDPAGTARLEVGLAGPGESTGGNFALTIDTHSIGVALADAVRTIELDRDDDALRAALVEAGWQEGRTFVIAIEGSVPFATLVDVLGRLTQWGTVSLVT